MINNLENKLDTLPKGNWKSFAKGFGKEFVQSAYTLIKREEIKNVGYDARDKSEYRGKIWGSVAFIAGTLGSLVYLGNLATRLIEKYSSSI